MKQRNKQSHIKEALIISVISTLYLSTSQTLVQIVSETTQGDPAYVVYHSHSNTFIFPEDRGYKKIMLYNAETGTVFGHRYSTDDGLWTLSTGSNTDFFIAAMYDGIINTFSAVNPNFRQKATHPDIFDFACSTHLDDTTIFYLGGLGDSIAKFDISTNTFLASASYSPPPPEAFITIFEIETVKESNMLILMYSTDYSYYALLDSTNFSQRALSLGESAESGLSPYFDPKVYFLIVSTRKVKKYQTSSHQQLKEIDIEGQPGPNDPYLTPRCLTEVKGQGIFLVFNEITQELIFLGFDLETRFKESREVTIATPFNFVALHDTAPYLAISSDFTTQKLSVYRVPSLCHPRCGSVCTKRWTTESMNCETCPEGFSLNPNNDCLECPTCCIGCSFSTEPGNEILCLEVQTKFAFYNQKCIDRVVKETDIQFQRSGENMFDLIFKFDVEELIIGKQLFIEIENIPKEDYTVELQKILPDSHFRVIILTKLPAFQETLTIRVVETIDLEGKFYMPFLFSYDFIQYPNPEKPSSLSGFMEFVAETGTLLLSLNPFFYALVTPLIQLKLIALMPARLPLGFSSMMKLFVHFKKSNMVFKKFGDETLIDSKTFQTRNNMFTYLAFYLRSNGLIMILRVIVFLLFFGGLKNSIEIFSISYQKFVTKHTNLKKIIIGACLSLFIFLFQVDFMNCILYGCLAISEGITFVDAVILIIDLTMTIWFQFWLYRLQNQMKGKNLNKVKNGLKQLILRNSMPYQSGFKVGRSISFIQVASFVLEVLLWAFFKDYPMVLGTFMFILNIVVVSVLMKTLKSSNYMRSSIVLKSTMILKACVFNTICLLSLFNVLRYSKGFDKLIQGLLVTWLVSAVLSSLVYWIEKSFCFSHNSLKLVKIAPKNEIPELAKLPESEKKVSKDPKKIKLKWNQIRKINFDRISRKNLSSAKMVFSGSKRDSAKKQHQKFYSKKDIQKSKLKKNKKKRVMKKKHSIMKVNLDSMELKQSRASTNMKINKKNGSSDSI